MAIAPPVFASHLRLDDGRLQQEFLPLVENLGVAWDAEGVAALDLLAGHLESVCVWMESKLRAVERLSIQFQQQQPFLPRDLVHAHTPLP